MKGSDETAEFDFERISILYANTNLGYAGMAAAIALLTLVIARFASQAIAIYWLLAMLICYIPRIILSINFARALRDGRLQQANITPWERHFFVCSIVPFCCFAAAVFSPYGDNSITALLFYAVIAMALTAGGIITYSTSLPTLLLFTNFTMLPLIAISLLQGDSLLTALAGTLAVAYLLLMRLIPRLNKVFLENIALKIENRIQSLSDPLTDLANRRRLNLFMERLIPAAERSGEPFTLVMADIDFFKQYNDQHGHLAGDRQLADVAKILAACSREQDLVVRFGGDEFLLVLPATTIDSAKALTDRIRQAVQQGTAVTISAGLAMHEAGLGFEALLNQADTRLYAAKATGRNSFKAG